MRTLRKVRRWPKAKGNFHPTGTPVFPVGTALEELQVPFIFLMEKKPIGTFIVLVGMQTGSTTVEKQFAGSSKIKCSSKIKNMLRTQTQM